MDFTPELSAFQGVLVSADNVHQFSRLTSKGGYEEKIKYVLDCMLRFLTAENYINENVLDSMVTKVRKFALYIVLNADLPVLEELIELDGIDTVIWTVPTIPKHLMCEMLWNLHMEQFIYEIISYSYPQLALEVAQAFIANFKYFYPTECVGKLHKLSLACYTSICRIQCFEFDNASLLAKLSIAFKNLQKAIKYFTEPPNSHKLNILSKDELYNYQGKSLQRALLLLYECLSQFTQKIDMNCCDNLYYLTYKEGSFKTNLPTCNVSEIPNNLILECLNNSNILLLDMCKELVMGVSVDVFCAWSEFVVNGKSMQQTIGELSDKVHTKLLSIESVCEHPIVSMVQQIARKPIKINDIINTVDNKTIVDNINNNDEDRVSWIKALIFKDQVCQHPELIQVIHANLQVYNDEECFKLYDTLKTYFNSDAGNMPHIKSLLIKVFQQCSDADKHRILKATFSDNCFCDMTEDEDFVNIMTELFNKLVVSPDADLTDVLTVFLQNPKQVYIKIFKTAAENIQQTDIMLKVMKLLGDYSNYYYNTETEPCIISVTKSIFENYLDVDSKCNNFIKFICGLKSIDIVTGTKLLLLIVMPNMHKALLNKDVNAIKVQIKLLLEAYTTEELTECRAPMLAMLAQVMDVVRWRNITVFVPTAPTTLNLTLQLQTALLHTYNGVVPDNESKWLKSKLKKMQPLNMYYYRILWNPPGKNFFEVISHMNVSSNTSAAELTSLLTQIICSSTLQEWCEIWDSLTEIEDSSLLKIFHDAVAMVTTAEASHRTEVTRACLLYCYKNLFYLIRYKYFKEPLTDIQVIAAVGNLANVLKLTQEADTQEIETLLMPLLAYMTERKDTFTIDLSLCFNKYFSSTNFAGIISRVFVNNTG